MPPCCRRCAWLRGAGSDGDTQFAVFQEGPDCELTERAFYQTRVIEVASLRWTACDARSFGIEHIPDDVQMVAQEVACTSPL